MLPPTLSRGTTCNLTKRKLQESSILSDNTNESEMAIRLQQRNSCTNRGLRASKKANCRTKIAKIIRLRLDISTLAKDRSRSGGFDGRLHSPYREARIKFRIYGPPSSPWIHSCGVCRKHVGTPNRTARRQIGQKCVDQINFSYHNE